MNKIINEEVQKLIDISSIQEVLYLNWLEKVVVLKKKNIEW